MKELLEEIGLTKGEITVYLTLLKLGETTTGQIIKQAQISSGKIYEILDRLIKKGLASYIIKERTKHFQASNPNHILTYIKEKENKLKQTENEIRKQIPLLTNIQKPKDYEATLLQGYEGIKTAINEAKAKEEVLAMGLRGSKAEKYNILWTRWHDERIKNKTKCRMIFSEKDKYFKKLNKREYTETRVIKGITPSAITIFKNKIFIFTYEEEPSCLVVKHPEIAKSFRTFFETLWGVAEK